MKEIILVSFFISSFINISSDVDFKDIKEFIKDYYSVFIYKGEKNQEFVIKEFIKNIKANKFVEDLNNVEKKEIIYLEEAIKKNEDREWIFEKLNFSDFTVGNQVIFSKVLSPEPKMPREYYKIKANISLSNKNKVLYIKLKPLDYEIGERYGQFFPSYYTNFRFNIEIYIFLDKDFNNLSNEIIPNLKRIGYSVIYMHDKSPLNTFTREIKIFGVLENIELIK